MYKINAKDRAMPRSFIHQFLLVMRITTLLLLLTLMQVSAETLAQRVSLCAKNMALTDVFKEIYAQTEHDFIFTTSTLHDSKTVTLHLQDVELDEALKQIFADQPLAYSFSEKSVVVTKRELATAEPNGALLILAYETVKGRIVDSLGNPLVGASVRALNAESRRTALQTKTDHDGYFELRNVPEDGLLEFSYIGYRSSVLPVSEAPGTITLIANVSDIDEVQVVFNGYQAVPVERATGSFSTLSSNRLEQNIQTDIVSKLDGTIPGVLFNRNSAHRIAIRGRSTLFSESNPLVIVDNFPFEGDIMDINPNDVASVTVLKDAAAASIWGAQAANGVIVITTKRASRNQPLRVDVRSTVSRGDKPNLFYQPRMATQTYVDLEKMLFSQGYYAAAENSSLKNPYTPVVQLLIQKRDHPETAASVDAEIARLSRLDIRNDLRDHYFSNQVNQQHALVLSGGSARTDFYASIGYDHNAEELTGNSFERVTINLKNSVHFFKDRLKMSSSLDAIQKVDNTPNIGMMGLSMTGFNANYPTYPYGALKDDQGHNARLVRNHPLSFIDNAQQDGLLDWSFRPLDELNDREVITRNYSLRLQSNMDIRIWDGFTAQALFQHVGGLSDYRNLNSVESFYSRDLINALTSVLPDGKLERPIPLGAILRTTNGQSTSYAVRTQLNYQKQWGGHSELTALAGWEARDNSASSGSNVVYGYDDNLALGSNVDYVNSFSRYVNPTVTQRIANNEAIRGTVDRHQSMYSNISYHYANQYTLYASARIDQSNIFGVRTNQKGVPLWSVGAAYQLSHAGFYPWSTVLPHLKLRTSYGYSGNVNKSISAFTTIRYSTAYRTDLPKAVIVNPPNPDLRWERVRIYNMGLDFETENAILSGSIDAYWKQGLDLIGEMPFPSSSGVKQFTANYANTKTNGIDVHLRSKNLNGIVSWHSEYLFSLAQDRVTHYLGNVTNYMTSTVPVIGRPQYSVFSYPYVGLNPENGNPVGYLNGETSENYSAILSGINEDNIIYHGSQRPTIYGGYRNTLTFKEFSISANIVYRLGYYFRRSTTNMSSALRATDQHADFELRWQQPGDERKTVIPSLPSSANANRDAFYSNTAVFVEKGDHIRLQDIHMAYTLPQKWASALKLRSANMFLYANNLGVVWKATDVDIDPDYHNVLYPPSRIYSLGIHINF